MKNLIFAGALGVGLVVFGGGLDETFLIGRTDKVRPFYARGEKMVFTLELKGAKEVPAGRYYIDWERTGDDGQSAKGEVPLPLSDPWTYETKLDRPGFVRLSAFVKDRQSTEKDKRFRKPIDDWQGKYVFFDGSAAVEPETLQGLPEPKDLDAFWVKRKARLAEVPITADLKPVPEVSNEKVKVYAVSVACAGPRPVTGYLGIPTDTSRKYPGRVEFDPYSWNSVQKPPKTWEGLFVRLWINAHGYELGREQKYYDEFYMSIRSAGKGYAFDKTQNDNPQTIYFGWMAYRVMRALQYVKSRPEWDGKNLEVSGMSQGGMQSLWAAALDPQVTYADVIVPWGCDWGGHEKLGRTRGGFDYLDWTPTLEYFDCVHLAKRIPRTTYVKLSRVGLGDYAVPPSGVQAMYNNLKCRKRLTWVQGGVHCWTPPDAVRIEETADAAIDYENPVWQADAPDPTVWDGGDGNWYSSSTSQRILKSRDLVHWEDTGKRLLEESEIRWIKSQWPNIWAPDVVKIGEWYNLYLTYHNKGEHTAIAAYRSKSPTGPFADRTIIIRSEENGRFEVIDPEVVVDPTTKRTWLFFGHGDVRRVELMADGRAQKPGAVVEHVAGWSLGAKSVPSGLPRWLVGSSEGAYLHRRGDKWYLFVSQGNWGDHTYQVAVGRADRLDGIFVDRQGRKMADGYATPILTSDKDDEFFGPGHNGEIFTSKSGRDYMFYHCHWKNLAKKPGGYCPRPMFLQEIFWDADGWPYFKNNGRPQKKCEWQ